jgi:hypothetical protein
MAAYHRRYDRVRQHDAARPALLTTRNFFPQGDRSGSIPPPPTVGFILDNREVSVRSRLEGGIDEGRRRDLIETRLSETAGNRAGYGDFSEVLAETASALFPDGVGPDAL